MGWKNNRLYGTERARGIYIYPDKPTDGPGDNNEISQ